MNQLWSRSAQVSLFHSPDLRGLTRLVLPERVNEVVGLQHMKLYIFDNSLVISGQLVVAKKTT